ncbi:MAG TPA: MFS transporter [Candidatus Binatia bacterium]|nr:MFS transporter [Candidatus Binatia bacterium]
MAADSSARDARRLLTTRALRGLADGLVSILLAAHLDRLGFTPVEIGVIVTGTLLGSAIVTMAVGLGGVHVQRRTLLLAASGLMLATGLGFAGFTTFWPLLVVAVLGTLNPTAGDVSVFLPVEQAALAQTATGVQRAHAFARYNVAGSLAGGLGALASIVPERLASTLGLPSTAAARFGFLLYAAVAIALAGIYRRLTAAVEHATTAHRPLASSRSVVFRLAALFSLDSFGGGFVPQSLVVLWLHQRFDLSVATAGSIFFAAGLLAAFSQLMSSRIAARIGYVRTMVYTHLPANVFLVLAGIVPSAPLAVTFLLLRSALSQMDVPARQAYVMALVPPEERTAASSVTNVPRSLAAALPPLATGWLLGWSSFGWPLVVAGIIKIAYDLLLLAQFHAVLPDEHA